MSASQGSCFSGIAAYNVSMPILDCVSSTKAEAKQSQNADFESIETMHNALLPTMCCNLNEFTRIGTYDPHNGQEVLVQGDATPPETSVKRKRVGRPCIYDDVDLSKLTEQELRKVKRCRANRESARRVREAKVTKVFVSHAEPL